MLPAILNKSWKQLPMKQQQYGHLHPISKTIAYMLGLYMIVTKLQQ